MKKFLLLASVCFSLGVSAQNVNGSSSIEPKMNIVKTNLPAYAFGNFNLTYERAINSWFSIAGGVNYIPKGKVPFIDKFDLASNDLDVSSAKLSNTAFTLETRFYLGEGYGKGFYLSPYYRRGSLNITDLNYTTEVDHKKIPIDISGKVNSNSFGLMLGAQWFLGQEKNWVIDWWIVGAHYGFGKGTLSGVQNKYILTQREQDQIKEKLSKEDIPFVKYDVRTNHRGVDIDLDGPWAGLRAGLSIGYRF